MGQSLSSCLVYGIHLGDTIGDIPNSLENHREALLKKEEKYGYIDYDGYFEKALGKDSEVIWHQTNYHDESELYLVMKVSCRHSSDGDPLKIEELHHHEYWDIKIKEACEKLNIEYTKPTWLIGCSYW